MSDYYLSGGYSETGENIVLEASWTHKWSELRCLCVVDDKEHQEFKVLNSNSILGSEGRYTIAYPFSVKGLPWRAYLWRETTKNKTISYDGGRVPVEAMLSKIAELSDKSDEAKILLERVMMFPEDTDGKMFMPPVNVRKGELLGFDDEGKPVVGKACKQVKELYEMQDACDDAAMQAGLYAQQAAQSANTAGQHAADSYESVAEAATLVDKAKGHALNAETWYQKTVSAGEKAVNNATNEANKAEQYATEAEASAVRAEAAAAEVELDKEELDKKLCYVACATKRVEAAEASAAESKDSAALSADAALNSKIEAGEFAAEAEEYAKQLSRVYKYCGTVATESALPTTGNSLGDVWNVSDTGLNYAWDGEAWDALAGDKYVTQNTAQEISAVKTFLKDLVLSGANTALRFFPLWDGDVFTRLESTKVKSSTGAFKRLEAIDVTGDARTFDFPLSSGMLATTDDIKNQSTPLFDNVPAEGNDNASIFGYIGTLRNLGAFGDACAVSRLAFHTRLSGVAMVNPDVALWARILKVVDGAWVVAAQSSHSVTWGECGYDAPVPFDMVAVPGVVPPSADEKIAIVFVNSPDAEAGASNGAVSCRCVSGTGKGGAFTTALGTPSDATGSTTYYPVIWLRFAPLSATTKEDLAQKANDTDVVHKTGEETIAGPKKFTSSINIGGKTLLETNVGSGGLKFAPVGSTAQTVLKRDGTNVVVQTQNAGVVQTTWTLPGGKTGTIALTSDITEADKKVVHLAGAEAITGCKWFEDLRFAPGAGVYDYKGNPVLSTNYLSVLPLETTTALGATAYGLHVSATGGLQLFGTHFLNGTLWDDVSESSEAPKLMSGLKIVNNNLSLYSTDSAAIGFDYADTVFFRTMPNSGNEATYYFQAWEWTDDSHTTKAATAGVKLLKPSQATELVPTSVLNMEEGDARYVKLGTPNGDGDDCTYLVVGDYSGRLCACETDSEYVLGCFVHDVAPVAGIAFPKYDGDVAIYTNYNKILIPMKSGTVALTSDIPDVSGFLSGIVEDSGYFRPALAMNIDSLILANGSVFIGEEEYEIKFPATSGTIATTEDLSGYVPKSDYDALLARVEALEAAATA